LGTYSVYVEDTREVDDPYLAWGAPVEIDLEPNRVNVLLDRREGEIQFSGEASGRLLDEYGHPVRDGFVQFWDPEDPFLGGYSGTDRLGRFTVRGLPVDTLLKYKVSSGFEETAYAIGEITITEASSWELGDIQLTPGGQISGRVQGNVDVGVYAQLIHLDPVSMKQSFVDTTWVNSTSGLYRFSQVPEGKYFVKLSQYYVSPGLAGLSGDGGYYGEIDSIKPVYWNDTRFGASNFEDAQFVEVSLGSRVSGINLELSPGGSISGTLSIATPDGVTPMTGSRQVSVNAYRETRDGVWKKELIDSWAGDFSDFKYNLYGLSAGNYKLEFIDSRAGNNSLARSFNGGALSLEDAPPIEIGETAETAHSTHNQIMKIAPPQASAEALDLDEIEASLLAQLEDEIALVGDANPGESVSIFAGLEFSGQFVSAFANSTPTSLGSWEQVDSQGYIEVALPSSIEPGSHRVGVQDSSGSLIGWTATIIGPPEIVNVDFTALTPARLLETRSGHPMFKTIEIGRAHV
jgi:hypothetical protein